ncbi:MAG: hypothetical protein SAMD01599839_08290 [Rectinema sp.]
MIIARNNTDGQASLASLPAAWKRRFPPCENPRSILCAEAEYVFSKIALKITWAWTGLEYQVIWIGKPDATIIPYKADPETFRPVSFNDFLRWYGLQIEEKR